MTADCRPTMGYDWEIHLLGPEMALLPKATVQALVDRLAKELPYTHSEEQEGYFEHKVGVCRSYQQIYERTAESLGRLREMLREEGAFPFSAGSLPGVGCVTGCHIHAGTYYAPGPAYALRNALTPYAPLLAALMVNSPFHRGLAGEHKSYRMARLANDDAAIRTVPMPETTEGEWGADIGARYPTPTLEARVVDTPFSWQLACECCTLFCALAMSHYRRGPSEGRLEAVLGPYAENRFRVVRHGLQAAVAWEGATVPVTEVLAALIEELREELGELGLDEPPLIRRMLGTRRTQADFQLDLLRQEPDEGAYLSRFARLSMRPEVLEDYLARAEPLPPLAPESVEDYIVAGAGEGAPPGYLLSRFPAALLEQERVLGRLEDQGRLLRRPDGRYAHRSPTAGTHALSPQTDAEGRRFDVVYWPQLVDPWGSPGAENRVARFHDLVLARFRAGYRESRWCDVGIGFSCEGGLPELAERAEELFAICRDTAALEDLVFAPMGMDVGLARALGMWLVPCAFRVASHGLRTLAGIQPLLPAFTALLANSYTERLPDWGPVKCGGQCQWFEPGWWGLIGRPEPWRVALHRQSGEDPSRVRWFRGRLSLAGDVLDAPTSPRLLAESAVLFGALAREQARATAPVLASTVPEASRCAGNWHAACRDGLQATFLLEEGPVPVATVLERALVDAEGALARLNASPADLGLIRTMLARRQTQADLQATLWRLDEDSAARQARRARVCARSGAFEDYLANAEELPPKLHPEVEERLSHVVGRDTPLSSLVAAVPMPHVERDLALRDLERRGRVALRPDEREGLFASRAGGW